MRGGFDMSFEKLEKEYLTNDFIQQDIINGLKNDSHITINIIIIATSVFFAFCFSFLTSFAWFLLLIPNYRKNKI